jgi:hypothetical protein
LVAEELAALALRVTAHKGAVLYFPPSLQLVAVAVMSMDKLEAPEALVVVVEQTEERQDQAQPIKVSTELPELVVQTFRLVAVVELLWRQQLPQAQALEEPVAMV